MYRTAAAGLAVAIAGSLAAAPAAADQFERWEHYQDPYAGVVVKRTGKTYRAVGWTKRAGRGTEWCFRGEGEGEDRVVVKGRMWWPDQKNRKKRRLIVTGSENGRRATVEVMGRDIPGWTIGPAKLTKKKPRYTFGKTCRR